MSRGQSNDGPIARALTRRSVLCCWCWGCSGRAPPPSCARDEEDSKLDATAGGPGSEQKRQRTEGRETHLLHNTGLTLGKGNVTPRLVADELDLNLAALAVALVVVIVVVVGGRGALALDAAGLLGAAGVAVAADRLGVVEVGRRLLVMVGDVGHVVFGGLLPTTGVCRVLLARSVEARPWSRLARKGNRLLPGSSI